MRDTSGDEANGNGKGMGTISSRRRKTIKSGYASADEASERTIQKPGKVRPPVLPAFPDLDSTSNAGTTNSRDRMGKSAMYPKVKKKYTQNSGGMVGTKTSLKSAVFGNMEGRHNAAPPANAGASKMAGSSAAGSKLSKRGSFLRQKTASDLLAAERMASANQLHMAGLKETHSKGTHPFGSERRGSVNPKAKPFEPMILSSVCLRLYSHLCPSQSYKESLFKRQARQSKAMEHQFSQGSKDAFGRKNSSKQLA
jgi:hypothetical protein